MDNIFIDTSVFEENNFLESRRINELLKLSEEGYIKIVLPKVTYEEILSRTRKKIEEAVSKFNRYRKDTRILRNIESLATKFEPIDEIELNKEIIEIIKKRFDDSKVEIIDYPTLNIESVFESYFNKTKPFSEGIKKNEFPDAFAMISLEKWCKENNKKCLVFAKDHDLISYASDEVKPVEYEEYLNTKLIEVEGIKQRNTRLKLVKKLFDKSNAIFTDQISAWVNEQLDDETKYYDYTNYLDLHDLRIIHIEITIEDYQITSATDSEISLQSEVEIYFEVEITTDDQDYGIYDDEDKEWIYYDTIVKNIEEFKEIRVDFIYQIPIAGEKFAELEIEKINEGKDLNL